MTMTIIRVRLSLSRTTVCKLFIYVFFYNLLIVAVVWFRMWRASSEHASAEQNDCVASDPPLLCIFTTFKPSAHKLQVHQLNDMTEAIPQ